LVLFRYVNIEHKAFYFTFQPRKAKVSTKDVESKSNWFCTK